MAVINPNSPPLPSLAKLLILGVMQRLSDVFQVPAERIIPISTSDRMKVAQTAAQKYSNGEIIFPQILLYTTAFIRGDTEQEYNARAIMRNGVYAKLDDTQNSVKRIHLFPAIMEIEVIYQTNDYFQGLQYGSNWLAAGLSRFLNFTITYMGVPLDIRVDLGSTIQVPELDADISTPNYYEYDCGIRVRGFLESEHRDDTDTVSMLRQVVTNYTLVDDVTKQPEDDPTKFSTVR